MKKRIFYVINLDRGRIITLSILLLGFLLLAYATGYRMADRRAADSYGDSREQPRPLRLPENEILDTEGSSDGAEELAEHEAQADDSNNASSGSLLDEDERRAEQARAERIERERQAEARRVEERQKQLAEERRQRERETQLQAQRERERAESERLARVAREKEASSSALLGGSTSLQLTAIQPAEKSSANNAPETSNTAAPATSTSSGSSSGNFALQLGAFSSEVAATRMRDDLRSNGFEAYIVRSGEFHLVRVGRASNREALGETQQQLRSKNYSPVMVAR